MICIAFKSLVIFSERFLASTVGKEPLVKYELLLIEPALEFIDLRGE